MLFLKPVFRTIILSLILAFLLIYLGIKYQWGDYLKNTRTTNIERQIPQKEDFPDIVTRSPSIKNQPVFIPEITEEIPSSSLIISMNKEQIAELCTNLLSKSIKDDLSLELAVTNCVVSNYQETYQSFAREKDSVVLKDKKIKLSGSCKLEVDHLSNHSILEKQLLVGICVSDQLSQ